MRFNLEIGEAEKHVVEFNFDQLLGQLVIKVNKQEIKPGTYKEKLFLNVNKPFVHLVGEAAEKTLLTYDDNANKTDTTGGTGTTDTDKAGKDAAKKAEASKTDAVPTNDTAAPTTDTAADTKPKDKDQYNFTDPESRIMKGADGFVQAYNAQAAVEADFQLIVGQAVTQASAWSGHTGLPSLGPLRRRSAPSACARWPHTRR